VTVLFDVLSFPHATYIFLFTAAIVACVLTRSEEGEPGSAHDRRPRSRVSKQAPARMRAPARRSEGAVRAEHR